jgi:hypothetical protein
MCIRWPLVPVLAGLAAACSSKEPRQREPVSREAVSLDSAFVDDVIPLVNGGAYVVGTDGLWYLAGTSAVRVRPVGDGAARVRFASAFSLDVQPTVDGGAYAWSLTGGIWRLEADSALPVKEAASIPPDITLSRGAGDSLGWLLYAKEHRASAKENDGGEEEPPSDGTDEMR